MVSHGAGSKASIFANEFGPYASVYNVILVLPQADKEWDDSAYSGSLYDTKNGVQPLFFNIILDQITGASSLSGVSATKCEAKVSAGGAPPNPNG